jgi:hypothetical protein
MIILVADHPVVVVAELRIRLPEAVVMFSLETLGSPCLSWLRYGMVHTGFADYRLDFVVVQGEAFVSEVTSYLVWSPLVAFS